jgi:hypothetical protein
MYVSLGAVRGRYHRAVLASGLWVAAACIAALPRAMAAQAQPPAGFDKLRVDSVTPDRIGSGGQVTVWLNPASVQSAVDPAELVLYLDHVPLVGNRPMVGGAGRSVLRYRLDRTQASRDAWLLLYRRHGREATVPIGVGLVPFGEIPTQAIKVSLDVVHRLAAVIGAVVALILAIVMIVWGKRLLHELPAKPSDPCRPYSLGRVQMAFWFTLVVGAYVFIAVATHEHNGILNDTTLTLMGIGVGAALGSAAIQEQKRSTALRKLLVLRPELERAQNQSRDTGVWQHSAELEAQVQDLESRLGKPCNRSFWKDLINDATGPSFHRFQMVAWTLLLGAIFIRHVVEFVAMPTFDATLLALLGISGGTYLGFKVTEQQNPSGSPP